MKLSRLERASDYEVKEWLSKELKLTPYQQEKLIEEQVVRFSPFFFYKFPEKDKKISLLWRLTIIVWPVYLLCLVIMNPFQWIFTGQWGYGTNFIDKFHSKWARKLGL